VSHRITSSVRKHKKKNEKIHFFAFFFSFSFGISPTTATCGISAVVAVGQRAARLTGHQGDEESEKEKRHLCSVRLESSDVT
jgi:hypothetical protein